MSKKIILIVDDHRNFREMVRSFIENNFKDIEIKEAETGEEGVAIAVKHKSDVCLIDVRLPGIDGIQATQAIKEQVPGCRIILMSMFQLSYIESLIDQDVITFINKDEIDSKLIPLLYKLLDGHKM